MLICERRVEPQKEEKPGGGGFPCTGCLRPRALALKAPWGGAEGRLSQEWQLVICNVSRELVCQEGRWVLT